MNRLGSCFALIILLSAGPIVANPSLTYREVDLAAKGVFALHPERGVILSVDNGRTWSTRSDGLPEKVVYPFDQRELRDLVSLSVDHLDSNRLAVVSDYAVYRSDTGGRNWTPVPVDDPVKAVDVLTAVARVPGNEDMFYLGTSFNGVFRTDDGGETWVSLEDGLTVLYRGAGFYEEIRGIAVSTTGRIVIAIGFGDGFLQSDDQGATWFELDTPVDGIVLDVYYRLDDDGREELVVTEPGQTHTLPVGTSRWRSAARILRPEIESRPDRLKQARLETAADRHGIYVNSAHASGDRLKAHLELLEEHDFNSIVVDMKDDAGYLTYDTDVSLAIEADAVRERFELDELVEAADEHDVYLIGRIVIFQDPRLYRYKDGAYAVWDTEDDGPWGNRIPVRDSEGSIIRWEQREYWVDPFSEDVWRYNISIAEELERRGVDEVQFDYVRFPSDGDLTTISYRFSREGMTKTDALESLLRLARESLDIPLGVDVFGYNGWYRMGNWIGQNLPVLSRWVDVVSPMLYPSHFPRSFFAELAYFDRAEVIYREGSDRAVELVDGHAMIRPYVQAFLIGGERAYEEPAYDAYLTRQLDGVASSGASGFTLWNASNIYYMVVSPLGSYVSTGQE